MSNKKGSGYYVGAECIVSVPTSPAVTALRSTLGLRVIDRETADNGKIVVLAAKLSTGSRYVCKVCKKDTINQFADTYWVTHLKDGKDFESIFYACDPKEAIFPQQWLIPIGNANLLLDETLESIDDMKSLAEKITGIS